jgi:hypothetical protein
LPVNELLDYLIYLHPIIAYATLAYLYWISKKRKAFRFDLKAALFLMMYLSALTGAMIFGAEHFQLTTKGKTFLLPPLPAWAISGCFLYAPRNRGGVISILEVATGASMGVIFYFVILFILLAH